jgi:oligopeptide/dipeptide ABC transporter ATP-binding protein
MTAPLVDIRDLVLRYPNGLCAVDGVSFTVARGETLAVVGESGCGKSSLGRSVLRIEQPTSGTITFEGVDITGMSRRALRPMRRHFQMIFQDPFASLDPRSTVRGILDVQLKVQGFSDKADRQQRIGAAIDRVGLDRNALSRYPHEFSGGQRQRIGIARALILEPSFIVCDEAVSALDVSIRAQIMNLLLQLQQERQLAYLFISHDMAVVRHLADRVAVMYLGRLVEIGDSASIFEVPRHPYTQALMASVPRLNPRNRSETRYIPRGQPPSPLSPPPGCHYHPRCPLATDLCKREAPPLELRPDGGAVACHHADEAAGHVAAARPPQAPMLNRR